MSGSFGGGAGGPGLGNPGTPGGQGGNLWINGWNSLLQFLSGIQQALASIAQSFKSVVFGLTANNTFTGNNTFDGTSTFNGTSTFSAAATFSGGASFKPPPTISAGATGTGTFQPEGVLSTQFSSAGIGNGADKTNDTLFSYALPAKSFDADGRGVRILTFGNFAANGNDKVITFQMNGAILINSGTMTDNSGWWKFEVDVYRFASNSQIGSGALFHGGAVGGPVNFLDGVTDTNAITFSVTGASPTTGAAKDVVANGMVVEFMN